MRETEAEDRSAEALLAEEPLLVSLLRLPARAAFVTIALVQIGVELAVTAAQKVWASRDDLGPE